MIHPWTPLPETAALAGSIRAAIPELRTKRLVLRASRAEDWPTLAPIWNTDRAEYIDGPYSEEDAWLDFCQAVAGWTLRAIGFWTVTRASDDAVLGFIGIGQETDDPELEFGWLLTEEAEGHGYATEAARAVRTYAFDTLGLRTLISFMHRDNHRSVAIAERLGTRPDPAALPDGAKEDIAYRHTPEAA